MSGRPGADGELVFICDDEPLIRMALQEHLEDRGYRVRAFESGSELLKAAEGEAPDLVLLDLRLPDGSGLDFLERLRELSPTLPVIMISAFGEVETAVAAVRAGAFHFLEKPIELAELFLLAEQALEKARLLGEVHRSHERNRWHFSKVTLVGRSPAMNRVVELITRLAVRGTPSTVLISGESGTGKEVVARAIHGRGPRHAQPFLTVNCTVLPEKLVESELFGHEAGAFTDARKMKPGLFELAAGGTLLLDEIGDMPLPAQATLLQVLETHRFRRVGGVRDLTADVHVVAATNRDLERAVAAGDFREDLYYRLNVFPIELTPLRERPEDIEPLCRHFVEMLCAEMRLEPRSFSPEALRALERHSWPGNARELRNLLERVLLLHDAPTITLDQLPPEVVESPAEDRPAVVLPAVGTDLGAVERDLIRQALARTGGNKSEAARLLGISRDTLRYRIEKYAIGDPQLPDGEGEPG